MKRYEINEGKTKRVERNEMGNEKE